MAYTLINKSHDAASTTGNAVGNLAKEGTHIIETSNHKMPFLLA